MKQDEIRKRVRLLKAIQNTSYKYLAECLEISKSSMYNWMHSQFDLSDKRAQQLERIINDLEE